MVFSGLSRRMVLSLLIFPSMNGAGAGSSPERGCFPLLEGSSRSTRRSLVVVVVVGTRRLVFALRDIPRHVLELVRVEERGPVRDGHHDPRRHVAVVVGRHRDDIHLPMLRRFVGTAFVRLPDCALNVVVHGIPVLVLVRPTHSDHHTSSFLWYSMNRAQ